MIPLMFGLTLSTAQAGQQATCDGLKVATGPSGKGYSKLFADMVRVSKYAMPLCEVNTEGGLDNLTTLSIKKADIGIVPMDALKKMAEGDANIAALLVVATLNSNYLHIVTSANGYTLEGPKKYGVLKGDAKTIRFSKMSELRGAPVALVGSAQLLVRQLDKLLGYNMRYIDVDSDDAAFKKVQSGQAYAAFTIAGWPHGQITRLTQASGLTLASFDVPIGSPYSVRPFSYKNIGVYNVQAVAVQNVLVTRPFSGSKTGDVAALKQMLERELLELKDGDYEPGWNEIKSFDGKVEWTRFAGAPIRRK
jgi:TRAP-type uncharacterized transport system substrate-binding protein